MKTLYGAIIGCLLTVFILTSTACSRYPELFLEDGKASEDLEEHAKAYCSVPLAFHEPIVNLADIRKQIEAVRAEELESGLTFPSKIG